MKERINKIRNILSGSCMKFLMPIRFADDGGCGNDLHDGGGGDDDDDSSTQREEINRNT